MPPPPPPPPRKKWKLTRAWHIAPTCQRLESNHPPQPLPIELFHNHILKFKTQQCIYTDGSFIPPYKNGKGNTAGSGVYYPTHNLHITKRLPCLQNILRAELNAILIAIQGTQHHTQDTYIFTYSLNIVYLIHNHIRHPSSQHNHPDKLLIAAIVNHITWSTHKIAIQKVRARICTIGNEIVDQLANNGALLDKPANIPKIHTAHTTPYWLNGVPTCTHTGAKCNLQTYINKEHKDQELRWAQSKLTYIDNWTSNNQINHKLSNQFWKHPKITDVRITQILKFQYAQYMGNHRKNFLWPNIYPNPNCTLCTNNAIDTWPHLLSTCSNQHLKGLRIARHNKALHQVAHTLQSNKHTTF